MSCMLEFILKSTTGPEVVSSADPGCSPVIILGIINIKNGTVKKAIIEYTAESVAFFSSDSMEERRANQAPYISSSAKMLVCLGSQFQKEPQANRIDRYLQHIAAQGIEGQLIVGQAEFRAVTDAQLLHRLEQ